MSEYKLAENIIKLSNAKTWDEAKLEWALSTVDFEDEPSTCLCGHYPIIEICVLKNNINSNTAEVGNCCVKKFMGLPSDKIFNAVKRVKKDEEKALNAETIAHAYRQGWINDWEKTFYFDTMRKRNPSPKQLAARVKINAKIMPSLLKKKLGK